LDHRLDVQVIVFVYVPLSYYDHRLSKSYQSGAAMPLFLSLLSLGCFAGAGTTFFRYDGRYFELLIMCAIILLISSEIVSAIRSSGQTTFDPQSADALHELKAINDRLVNVQLAVERLDRPNQSGRL
jgi:hypothetical protein